MLITTILTQQTLKTVIMEAYAAYTVPEQQHTVLNQKIYILIGQEITQMLHQYLHKYNIDNDLVPACMHFFDKEAIVKHRTNPYNLNKLLLSFNAINRKT